MRYGSTAAEQEAGKSLDEPLGRRGARKAGLDLDDDRPEEDDWDENATDEDIARLAVDDGPDSRAGRLVADDATQGVRTADLIAHDSGIDGGGATAEEAAVHVVNDEGAEL